MKQKIIISGIITLVIGLTGLAIVNSGSKTNPNATEHANPNSTSTTKEEVKPEPNQVIIQDFAFTPTKMTVKKGTTVTWTNQDSARHDVMPDNPSDDFKPSQLLAKGETYSFTFNKPGSYSYHCSPHPYMKATVEVTE